MDQDHEDQTWLVLGFVFVRFSLSLNLFSLSLSWTYIPDLVKIPPHFIRSNYLQNLVKEHKLDLEIKAELYHQKIVIWLIGLMAIIACDQSRWQRGSCHLLHGDVTFSFHFHFHLLSLSVSLTFTFTYFHFHFHLLYGDVTIGFHFHLLSLSLSLWWRHD